LGHQPVLVGDVKLSNFRQVLVDHGFKAEFKSGSLVVNNYVLLRRDSEGSLLGSLHRNVLTLFVASSVIEMEGVISDDFYRIRELLLSQLIVL
jgi:cleavage and polyadenylation specificity factor subunit 2